MAVSICPRCGKTGFEMKEAPPIHNAVFKHNVIQCSHCGCVISFTYTENLQSMLNKICVKLGIPIG